MTKTFTIFAAAALAIGFAASSAQAGLHSDNGIDWNGVSVNALTDNALTLNGMDSENGITLNGMDSENALTLNALDSNGMGINGLAGAGIGGVVTAITLPAAR